MSALAEALFTSVRPGLNKGRCLMMAGFSSQITGVAPGEISTRVIAGGALESHKGINLPGAVRTAALRPRISRICARAWRWALTWSR